VVDFYPAINLRLVGAEELSGFGSDLRMLCNMNSPKDLLTF
jgi:hypothetical protein